MTTPPPPWMPSGSLGPLGDLLGIRILDFDPDRLVATMPVTGNEQTSGRLHGGATSALLESVGSCAAMIGAGPDRRAVGIELNASYVTAPASGTVTAVCTPVRRGRTLATFLIQVTDASAQLIATGRLTCMLVPA